MRRKSALYAIAFVCMFVRFAQADLLTIGSPAPEFTPEKFVQGTSVTKLKRGQKYVIEFSGTNCGPCIQFIPHIENLKNKYKQFTFISVFCEPEDKVQGFLKGPGAKMSTHIACDSTGAVDQNWMQQAAVLGIPFVFVVNEDSKIAWMGSPERLAGVLSVLATQKTVTPEELMRVTLVQHARLQTIRTNERWNEAQRYRRDVINRLVNKGLHSQAIEAIDKAIKIHHEFPDVIDDLRTFKFYEMARVPGTRDAARTLAFDIAAEYHSKGDSGFAGTLVQHYEVALPENKDKEFVLLAITLLQEAAIPSNDKDTDNQLTMRRNYFSSLAKANFLLGRHENARDAIQKAISFAETQVRKRREDGAHELNITSAIKNLARLKKRLATYSE